jgi:hypothetical protein
VTVRPAASSVDLDAFITLPWRLYKGTPHWVPPLLRSERELFSPKHNPFFQHADVQLFLARRAGQVVGRISAQVDHEHNRYHQERTGFFGFFESEHDPAVANALLTTAEQWLREKGMQRVRGPLSFSINGVVGFLVEGFDSPPFVMMPYSPDYYLDLVELCGYAKIKDLFAWRWESHPIPEPMARKAQELRQRPEVKVRTVDMRRFDEEVHTVLGVFNDAWGGNWGFVPATPPEADRLAHDLRLIIEREFVAFVEINGIAAAVFLAVPNLNEAIHDLGGRLFPLGLLKLLWRAKVRGLKTRRVLLLGVKKQYWTRQYAGLIYLLCDELARRAVERGYPWSELSWTLEDNGLINAFTKKIGAERYKTYRIYEKTLSA